MTDNSVELINNTDIADENIPELDKWEPTEEETYVVFDSDIVRSRYDNYLGLREDSNLGIYVINKNHYRDRMPDICKVINYFLNFFDKEKELFHSTLSIKFIIDQKTNMKIKAFQNMIMERVITDSFIEKIKSMTDHLYTINIDTDEEGKYKSTPKITNVQAKLIVAVSFAIRCILPLCIHYSDTNNNFIGKKDYIKCFDKIIMKIIKRFEEDDVKIFNAICKFVKYRVDRFYSADIGICIKKKQLYGMVKEIYLEEVIHEVILVKSLYKLDYNRSVVSFIDGVIFLYHYNFKIENFKFKPVEIDPQEASNDDDEHLSHAEAIDMRNYRVDESNSIISEANTAKVLKSIEKKFNIDIEQEELDFYNENVKISSVTQFFLDSFYAKFFHDANAIYSVNRETTIKLLIYMKKFLQLKGMKIIPQICTSKIRGKYKENVIKNAKFNEEVETSSSWNNIINAEYSYIDQLDKDNPIKQKLSSFINSTLEFVDYNEEVNGLVYEDIDRPLIIHEFSLFLTIII